MKVKPRKRKKEEITQVYKQQKNVYKRKKVRVDSLTQSISIMKKEKINLN